MAKFRVGKNYVQVCPPCPQATPCLNRLTEQDIFETGDTVYALYETECVGYAPIAALTFYKQDINKNWIVYYSTTPGQNYPTAFYGVINAPPDGCYKVEYAGNTKYFSVGVACSNNNSNTKGLILAGIIGIGYYLYRKNKIKK